MENAHIRRLIELPQQLFGLRDMIELRRQRRALERLDMHLLRDIGLDYPTAKAEAQRPLWDVPRSWRR